MGKQQPYIANMKFRQASAQLRIERILELLKLGEMLVYEIAEAVHCSINSASAYVNYLHKVVEPKQLYIVRWKNTGTKREAMTAVYKAGSAKDAPKPKAKTSTQKSKIAREKLAEAREAKGYVDRRKRGIPRKARPDVAAAWIRPLTATERKDLEK